MSDARRNGWKRAGVNPWARALSAWALVSALSLSWSPSALAQGETTGERLVENKDPLNRTERLDCQGAFCVWWNSWHSACSGEYCFFDTLYVTDREGHVVSEHANDKSPVGQYTHEVRFIAPRRIEILEHKGPFNHEREIGAETGVDPSWVRREVWNLSSDGKTLTQDPKAVREPDWKRQPQAPAPSRRPPPKPEVPSLKVPVKEAVLAKARAACESSDGRYPLHHECRRGSCVLVLSSQPEYDELSCRQILCPVLVKGSQVRALPLSEEVVRLELTPTEYVFTACDGPYGSLGSQLTLLRARPEFMVFSGTEGLHVEGSEPYPVREAKSFEAARALAPTVHAYTRFHIPWGRDAWRDEHDLSLAWQLMRVDGQLRLHAEVDDDVLVPFTTGTGVHSDHLELTVSRGRTRAEAFKLGVLLAPEGKLQVRLWQREEGGKKRDVEEAFAAARGTWRKRERGYEVELDLPLDSVRDPAAPLVSHLSVFVSDADKAHKQETLMGHEGSLRFWTEYPPSLEEYQRTLRPIE
ncbi:hypothetical protein [Archangium minus]